MRIGVALFVGAVEFGSLFDATGSWGCIMEAPTFTTQEYETFELLVSARTGEGYPVVITSSPAGEASGFCSLDPSTAVHRVALQGIESGEIDDRVLAEFGCCLFNAIFPGPIAAVYRSSLGRARAQGRGLRVRLRMEPSELAELPWEYLCDGEEDCFLALSAETPLVRHVPMPRPSRPIAVRPPLRVLVVLCSPTDVLPLDAEQERAHERLEKLDILDLFDAVVTFDMTGKKKPAPDSLSLALDKLGVGPDEAILVGDSLVRDIGQGKALGMITVHASYGDRNLLQKGGETPDFRIDSVEQIREVVSQLSIDN